MGTCNNCEGVDWKKQTAGKLIIAGGDHGDLYITTLKPTSYASASVFDEMYLDARMATAESAHERRQNRLDILWTSTDSQGASKAAFQCSCPFA